MRRIFSILFLFIFLGNFAGFYIFFSLQLSINRQQMREELKTLPEEKLQCIVLSISDFEKALVDEREIKLNGKMYDIARIEKNVSEDIVYAVHDEKEDNLLTLIDFILKKPVEKKHIPQQVFQFLLLTYLKPEFDFNLLSFIVAESLTPYNYTVSEFNPPQPNLPPEHLFLWLVEFRQKA